MSLAQPSRDKSVSRFVISDIPQLDTFTHDAWHLREKNRQKARELAEQVLQSTDNAMFQAQAKIVLAYIAWREGHLAEALEFIQPALTTTREQSIFWLARALNVQVCMYSELGEFAQCAEMLEEQLIVSRAANNPEMEACAIHDMGAIHLEREPAKAEPFFHRALELFNQIGLEEGRGYTLLNLAFVYETQEKFSKAQRYLDEVLGLANHHHLEHLKSYAIAQQGRLVLQQGNFKSAKEYFLLALERTEHFGDRPIAELIPSIVHCYRQLGNLNEAKELLERHLEVLLRESLLPFALQAHEFLTEILEEQGDFQAALHHSREHMRLYRKVYSHEHENKVRALEVLYRTRLAEQRAATEQKRSRELSHALSQLEHLNQQTLEASFTDELTGLRNRRYLMKHCTDVEDYSLAMIDLDHFKRINDTYGHDAGDAILKEFAAFLKDHIREVDIPIRFGGEEFIVLFPDTTPDKAQAILTRLLANMKDYKWSPLKPGDYPTFTAGIAECSNGDLKETMQIADMLLYKGKQNGRNGVWVAKV